MFDRALTVLKRYEKVAATTALLFARHSGEGRKDDIGCSSRMVLLRL
jgi:hypothetical protein